MILQCPQRNISLERHNGKSNLSINNVSCVRVLFIHNSRFSYLQIAGSISNFNFICEILLQAAELIASPVASHYVDRLDLQATKKTVLD
jgi:hypothetical protein